jgi:hypothetical protein
VNTATAPAPRPPARQQPVPWASLAWVTWRQHRAGLAGTVLVLGGLSLYLLVAGLLARSSPDSVSSQTPKIISALVLLLPVLIGSFTGAPLLARELETGTFRYAWTQGCGRRRWAITKLALLAGALTAAAGAFSVLFSWYIHPFIAGGQLPALKPLLFPLLGVAFAAWTLAAFSIAAFTGTLIQRTVPALAASLAAVAGLELATSFLLRQRYLTPLTTYGGVPGMPPGRLSGRSWVLSSWTTGPGGRVVSQDVINQAEGRFRYSSNPNAFGAWMTQHHFTQWWSYQPQGRFWPFQLIEGGWLLALSIILIAVTVWLVRHHA